MWLLTTRGCFSVVAHPDDEDLVCVRARVRDDLLALRDLAPGIEPCHEPDTDYPWRAELPRDIWAHVVAAGIANEIDYQDFKQAVAERQGSYRVRIYTDIWAVLRRLREISPAQQVFEDEGIPPENEDDHEGEGEVTSIFRLRPQRNSHLN